jgi:hypothetical protein
LVAWETSTQGAFDSHIAPRAGRRGWGPSACQMFCVGSLGLGVMPKQICIELGKGGPGPRPVEKKRRKGTKRRRLCCRSSTTAGKHRGYRVQLARTLVRTPARVQQPPPNPKKLCVWRRPCPPVAESLNRHCETDGPAHNTTAQAAHHHSPGRDSTSGRQSSVGARQLGRWAGELMAVMQQQK